MIVIWQNCDYFMISCHIQTKGPIIGSGCSICNKGKKFHPITPVFNNHRMILITDVSVAYHHMDAKSLNLADVSCYFLVITK